MWKLLLACLLAVAMGQIHISDLGGFPHTYIGEYHFEYDDGANIVIIMSEMECFIVEAPDATWDNLFRNAQELYPVGQAIVKKIEAKTGLHKITLAESVSTYHSRLEELQCKFMPIYVVPFTA
ncbi:uncharacterized protein LOC112575998 isoform X2 [Pomacea canaliculata]|uniref:uncharacterized protein LOC112575998 isoform X1 n=1 Tax=Pomacea canaliculata TaxID=400727 RepID=UPI000D728135|nr:uncharacterized protein LOC112575998 isoform X1 [Pomacea canaliculata]XP_025113974.1 uncharacterized protein LOC112575998 isoform X2 [Pomacea canaliculata]